MALSKEQIAALLSIKTLQSGSFGQTLKNFQQRIDEQGKLQTGVGDEDSIVTYKNDLFASPEDIDNILNSAITEHDLNNISSGMGAQNTINALVDSGLINPPDNVSQFLNFDSGSQQIDPVKLHEILSTNIHELLPDQVSRQIKINEFFRLFQDLIPPQLPPYCTYEDDVGLPLGVVVLDTTGECNGGFRYQDWLLKYDISFIQDAGLLDSEAKLTREKGDINQFGWGENDANEYGTGNLNKSIEYLRNYLNDYLKDIDNKQSDKVIDSRPEYTHQSDGFLEIRNLNQGIIIKKGEGTSDVGIGKTIKLETGVVPIGYEMTGPDIWVELLKQSEFTFVEGVEIPEYLLKGFTITQWVRFRDKVNGGTLFNFGNPHRLVRPEGFRIETFVIGEGQYTNPDDSVFYTTNDQERFIRLVVREADGVIRDSHFGITFPNGTSLDRIDTSALSSLEPVNPFQYTRFPKAMDEWYFIVATYNPLIDENHSSAPANRSDYYYWLGNRDEDTSIVPFSGLGSKCKVEIISKSDLLRARGFKPEETIS